MRHCTHCGAPTPDDARFCPACGTALVVAASGDPLLGQVIADRYLLIEKIGQGGSGVLYRGDHTTLHKRVALKILHAQLATDETAVERFRREATTVAELDNEHILQVLDFGRTTDQRLFFAMEYLEGETLAQVIEREGSLPIPRALDILIQLSEALMEAHGLGYVHRDLRPRNVFLINRRGRADFVKLLEFGLAKLVLPDHEAKQTVLGIGLGDARYLSPELARGEALDRRADIYALGVIAYEMLTGSCPFSGASPFEILQQHLDAAVPKVRARRPDCPAWLELVVERALAKRPDDRFVTVLKLLDSLRAQAPPAEEAAPRLPAVAGESVHPVIQSMGPANSIGAPHQTLAMTPVRPRRAGAAAAGQSISAAGSVEVTPAPARVTETGNVPSVVVETSSQDKTQPAKFGTAGAVSTAAAPKTDPLGEWFSSDSQPIRALAESEELPRKSRGPLIIGLVAGGLSAAGLVVFLLLPKAQHKPAGSSRSAAGSAAPAQGPRRAAEGTGRSPTARVPAIRPTSSPLDVASLNQPAAPSSTPAPPPPTTRQAKQEAAFASPASANGGNSGRAAEAKAGANAAREKEGKSAPNSGRAAEAKAGANAAREKEAKSAPNSGRAAEAKAGANAAREKEAQVTAAARVARSSEAKSQRAEEANSKEGERARPTEAQTAQAEFFIKLGWQKLHASELSAAASNFNKAHELDPRSVEAIAGLGEVAFEQGEYTTAAAHLKQALRLSPKEARYVILLGQSYYKLGHEQQAIEEYKRALRLEPGNREAQHSLEVAERKQRSGG